MDICAICKGQRCSTFCFLKVSFYFFSLLLLLFYTEAFHLFFFILGEQMLYFIWWVGCIKSFTFAIVYMALLFDTRFFTLTSMRARLCGGFHIYVPHFFTDTCIFFVQSRSFVWEVLSTHTHIYIYSTEGTLEGAMVFMHSSCVGTI